MTSVPWDTAWGSALRLLAALLRMQGSIAPVALPPNLQIFVTPGANNRRRRLLAADGSPGGADPAHGQQCPATACPSDGFIGDGGDGADSSGLGLDLDEEVTLRRLLQVQLEPEVVPHRGGNLTFPKRSARRRHLLAQMQVSMHVLACTAQVQLPSRQGRVCW